MGWGSDVARYFRVWRRTIRRLRSGCRRHGRSQFVELRARRLRMGPVWMRGQESTPPLERLRSFDDAIVQVFVDLGCGDWIDRGNLRLRLGGGQRLGDDGADVIKPLGLRDVLKGRRRGCGEGRERQRQKEHVFPRTK